MRLANICFILTAVSIPSIALADPATSSTEDGLPSYSTASAPVQRAFLFTPDPSLPAPLQVIGTAGMGNVTRSGEERPVGAGAIVPTIGVEVGLLRRLSFYVDVGGVFWSHDASASTPVTIEAGARILLSNPGNTNFLLTLQPSYGLDFYGNNTLLLNASAAWNYGKLRVAGSMMASHTFQPGADPLDLTASIGASVKVPLGFRLGVEGVVADVEELTNPEDEGGASAFIGPTLGWEWRQRYSIVAGPAYGVGPNYTGFLARVALSAYL